LATPATDFELENIPVLEVDKLSEKALSNLKSYAKLSNVSGGCTIENAMKRREWCEIS
jgi:hypothetical protein